MSPNPRSRHVPSRILRFEPGPGCDCDHMPLVNNFLGGGKKTNSCKVTMEGKKHHHVKRETWWWCSWYQLKIYWLFWIMIYVYCVYTYIYILTIITVCIRTNIKYASHWGKVHPLGRGSGNRVEVLQIQCFFSPLSPSNFVPNFNMIPLVPKNHTFSTLLPKENNSRQSHQQKVHQTKKLQLWKPSGKN